MLFQNQILQNFLKNKNMNFVFEKLKRSDNQKINKFIRDIDFNVQFFETSNQKNKKKSQIKISKFNQKSIQKKQIHKFY